MKICLLTYDVEHLKTTQVFMGLHNFGKYDISFLAVPFTKRPERDVAFAHRPYQFTGVRTRDLAKAFNLPFRDYEDREAVLEESDYLIVCGANILEPNFANSGKIINGHAGIIPHVRGLDSFKWAIYDMKAIGNTLHIIDERADFGEVLHQIRTPLFRSDTLEEFAARHYDNEIWMLTHFERFLKGGDVLDLPENNARMRMKKERELEMLERFDAYKDEFALD